MRVHLFTLIQITMFAVMWVVKSIKFISILFPVLVYSFIFIRTFFMLGEDRSPECRCSTKFPQRFLHLEYFQDSALNIN